MFNGFSFKDHTKEEKIKITAEKKKIEESTKSAEETLRDCLESDTFRKYREELDKSNTALMEVGIGILKTIKDSKERTFLYDALFTRAEVLGLLLKKVESEEA